MRSRISRPSPRSLAAAVALMVLAVVLVVLHVRAYTALSPLDELQHVDYLDQASRFDFVHNGERVGQLAMREQTCRTVDSPGFVSPPCKARDLKPVQFQEGGFNTASADPPTYYVLTGLAARTLVHLPGVDSLVTGGRLVGGLWLGLGLVGAYTLARRLGARADAAFGAVALLATTPVVLHASATVTSDAPALLVGALLFLAGLAVLERGASSWWLFAAAVLAALVKVSDLVAVGAVFLVVLMAFRKGGGARPARGRLVRALLALVVGAVLPTVLWTAVSATAATPQAGDNPMDQRFHVAALTWGQLSGNATATLTAVKGAYTPAVLATPTVSLLAVALDLLLIVALAGAAWFGTGRRSADDVARGTLAAMLLGGPGFVLLVYVGAHAYVPIPSRYGLSLLPAAAAVLAVVAARHRFGGRALLGLGAVGVLAVLVPLV